MTTLRLTVSSAPPDSTLSGQHMDIGVTGATLGRAASNQCVLPDSERIVSSKHASIAHELGQYVITDHSTNGTFINDSPSPLGPNNTAVLKEGDSVAMGKYLFTVKLLAEQAAAPPNAGTGSFLDDLGVPAPAAAPPAQSAPAADATGLDDLDKWLEPESAAAPSEPRWGASNVVQADAGFEEENDPLAAIDQARRSDDVLGGSFLDEVPAEDDQDWWKGSQKDSVDPLHQAFDAPRQPQTPAFDAEPTPVPAQPGSDAEPPAFAADDVPAVEDADALDALLGLDSGAAEPAPDMPEPAADMSSPAIAAQDIVPERTEPPVPDQPDVQAEPAAPQREAAPVAKAQQPAAQEASGSSGHGAGAATPADTAPREAGASQGDIAPVLAQLLELGNLDQKQLDALTPEVVSVLQVTISHLLELLRARSSIKNELRLDRTMIQPVENNPLKFALTEKDALRYLFGEHSGAYMSGSKAVKEAFNDVAGHQMALLAGMRSAYEKMLHKFSPQALETRFGEAATKGLLSSKKARLWDAYVEYFDKLQQDPETSFNRLFGEEFASAYETQVDDIKSSKSDR